MDIFQNLLLDEGSSSEEEGIGKRGSNTSEKIKYEARECEPQWYIDYIHQPPEDEESISTTEPGSIHDMSFMVLKYKADLLYHHREYKEAAELFEKMLVLVPKRNMYVAREVRDSLAHCYLRIGEGQRAMEEAEKLVCPPHDKDWSSWKLLAECHELLKNYEAQVLALQLSASLQRCHSNFWVLLAGGYKNLRSFLEVKSEPAGPARVNYCSEDHASLNDLVNILVRTVQLFRPYFSWRCTMDENNDEFESNLAECGATKDSVGVSTANAVGASPSTVNASTVDASIVDASTVDVSTVDASIVDASTVDASTVNASTVDASTVNASTVDANTVDASTVDPSTVCANADMGALHSNIQCPEDCIFSGMDFSEGSSYYCYCTTMLSGVHGRRVLIPAGAVTEPHLRLRVCLDHSPFVMLVRRLISPEEFIELVRELLCEDAGPGAEVALLLLRSIYAMGECSSLVWSRQLLYYSVRYSHSFAKESLKKDQTKVEEKLSLCHTGIRNYILKHLTKRSVFD